MNNLSDQLFKKRQGKKIKRAEFIKNIAPYRYLIVCEGEKTEPYYFEGIKKIINEKYGNKIVVKNIKTERIEIYGTGRNTENLVQYTIDKRRRAEIPYGNVWCVFDKDSFSDHQFNNAIVMAESNNIKVAWSNEAIELWFILHFEYLNSGISREKYIKKLNSCFSNYNINNGKYEKNIVNIYDVLTKYGDIKLAIKYAKMLKKEHSNITPSLRNPSTELYKLIEELMDYLKK
ncbi:MAG: RloB family protein [Clostridiales bacterium]